MKRNLVSHLAYYINLNSDTMLTNDKYGRIYDDVENKVRYVFDGVFWTIKDIIQERS